MLRVIGKAKDGVRILRPATKPANFTLAQARAAVRKAKAALLGAGE